MICSYVFWCTITSHSNQQDQDVRQLGFHTRAFARSLLWYDDMRQVNRLLRRYDASFTLDGTIWYHTAQLAGTLLR